MCPRSPVSGSQSRRDAAATASSFVRALHFRIAQAWPSRVTARAASSSGNHRTSCSGTCATGPIRSAATNRLIFSTHPCSFAKNDVDRAPDRPGGADIDGALFAGLAHRRQLGPLPGVDAASGQEHALRCRHQREETRVVLHERIGARPPRARDAFAPLAEDGRRLDRQCAPATGTSRTHRRRRASRGGTRAAASRRSESRAAATVRPRGCWC